MSELKDSSTEGKKKLCRKCRRRLQQNKEDLVASTAATKARGVSDSGSFLSASLLCQFSFVYPQCVHRSSNATAEGYLCQQGPGAYLHRVAESTAGLAQTRH